MLDLVNTLLDDLTGLFVTCTYRQNQMDYKAAKNHLKKVVKWLRYHYPESSCIWRMERQDRGAIHFHFIIFGVGFIPADALTAYWQKITGDDSYPDVHKIYNRRHALHYVAKYSAKPNKAGLRIIGGGLPSMDLTPRHIGRKSYLKGFRRFNQPVKVREFVGRFWGVSGRDKLPFAPSQTFAGRVVMRPFYEMRRGAAARYAHILRRASPRGFSFYCDNSSKWADYWRYCLGSLTFPVPEKFPLHHLSL